MGADQHTDWRAEIASTLDWWRDAGVDTIVGEAPFDWLAPEPAKPAAVQERATVPTLAMPGELTAFLAWRSGPEAPEQGWARHVLAPAGAAGQDLLVVTDMPDPADETDGALLSGAAGKLFDNMLAAIGRDRGSVGLTALALARPRGGRLPDAAAEQLTAILRHHLALAAPKRVLLLGNAVSRALLSLDCLKARGTLHVVNHGGGTSAEVASLHPRLLLERPQQKAEAWKDLQLLIRGWS